MLLRTLGPPARSYRSGGNLGASAALNPKKEKAPGGRTPSCVGWVIVCLAAVRKGGHTNDNDAPLRRGAALSRLKPFRLEGEGAKRRVHLPSLTRQALNPKA